ncbi:MAG TPA: hypothetical protein VM818_23170 [Vicinamibacterales bacterium]|nr:hypothetical protein [Vicinamibacterales bacterium]
MSRSVADCFATGSFFVAVWPGIATAVLPHPRAWLAAHLTAFFTCLILVAIGLVWRELRLTERQRLIGLITGFTSAYLGLVGNIFSAIVDLPGPASQPGVAAPMPQAAIFSRCSRSSCRRR